MLTVAPGTIPGLWASPGWDELLAEYAAESSIEGMPEPQARLETYAGLERAGVLHVIDARVLGRLVGFITILAVPLPHYGITTAVSESFFVARNDRSTGAGLRLLKAAEDKARELGSPGLLVSAPFEGDLFRVLPRRGYRETNRVFFKRVTHA